jgi:hypothetical protein
MSILRGFILAGNLGRIWAKNHFVRRVFQSVSVLAYYQLMENLERRSRGSYTVVRPEDITIDITEIEMKNETEKVPEFNRSWLPKK